MSYLDDPDHVWELDSGAIHAQLTEVFEDLLDRVYGSVKNVGDRGPTLGSDGEQVLFRIMRGTAELDRRLRERREFPTLGQCLHTAMVWEFG